MIDLKKFFTKLFHGTDHYLGEVIFDEKRKYPAGVVVGDPDKDGKQPFRRFNRITIEKYWLVVPTKNTIFDMDFFVPFVDNDQERPIHNEFDIDDQFEFKEEEYMYDSDYKNRLCKDSQIIKICNSLITDHGKMLLPSYSTLLNLISVIRKIKSGGIQLEDETRELIPYIFDPNDPLHKVFPSSSTVTFDKRVCLKILSYMWPVNRREDYRFQMALNLGYKTYIDYCRDNMKLTILPTLELK